MPENAIERRYKILVADDDPDTRAIVSSVVGLLPCEIEEAVDGIDALQKFEKFQPDLAILDIMMPGLNGNQVCQKIKHSQHGGLVPVLMLTARDSVQDKVDSFEIGADDYQTKPFNYQELQARVKALLRVRDLNIKLHAKNLELQAASEKLVEQERQLVVMQLAGTAAHQLGQPLSAILLNCHLLERLTAEDPKFKAALNAIKQDTKRMAELIDKLKSVDAKQTSDYYGEMNILQLESLEKYDATK